MAGLNLTDNLQPALLDRLTDDERLKVFVVLRVDLEAIETFGIDVAEIVGCMGARGLHRSDVLPEPLATPAGERLSLGFAVFAGTVRASQIREFSLIPKGMARRVKFGEFCEVEALTTVNAQLESLDVRSISMRRLRESVCRDLGWLLNAISLDSTEDLSRYPEVVKSVVNYGMTNLAGQSAVAIDREQLARRIQDTIRFFEPRLSDVRVIPDEVKDDVAITGLTMRVEAQLWGRPLPQLLSLRTRVDLETGSVRIDEESA